jgi:hypothetical protein
MQKDSKETTAALQIFRAFKPEEHQRQMNTVFAKLGDHADANKQTQERMTKMVLDVLDIRKRNLHMEVTLEQIGQHLGLPSPSVKDRAFPTPGAREPYRPAPLRDGSRTDSFGSPLPTDSATPLSNQSNNANVAKLTLEPVM